MEQLSPAEIIKFRAECFKASDGAGVFSLYSLKSDLRKLFTEKNFKEHFSMLAKDKTHAGIKLVAENVKNNLAEVKYIEYISENMNIHTFYSKTILTKEEGKWKILREIREESKS